MPFQLPWRRTDRVEKAAVPGLPAGAKISPLDPALIAAQAGIGNPNSGTRPDPAIVAAMAAAGMDPGQAFSPGQPIPPYFGYGRDPRQFDFVTGTNITQRPRTDRVSFDTLKALVDSYDTAQICIAHRINSLRSLRWHVTPKPGVDGDAETAVRQAEALIRRPDGQHAYASWVAMWAEDVLRYDAGSFYRRRDRAGRVIALEVVSGRTVAPMLDYYGRRPASPAPAFVQFANGVPWDWLSAADLIYEPFRPQVDSPYGLAPIETILLSCNSDLRLQQHFLDHFTEGNVPAAIAEAPADLSDPKQVQDLQEGWDAMLAGNVGAKSQVRWVPAGSKFTPLHADTFDEAFALWLTRKTCAAFAVVPQDIGITLDVNRASGDTQNDIQERVGEQPLVAHLEQIINSVLQDDLGLPVEFSIDTGRMKEDRLAEAQAWNIYINSGMASADEGREQILGLPTDSDRPVPRFVMDPRIGPVPLASLYEVAGPVDQQTAAPSDNFPLPDDPFIGTPGIVPNKLTGGPAAQIYPDEPRFPQLEVPHAETIDPAPAGTPVAKADNVGLVAAGLIVKAADTGRVLMLQRSLADLGDPAAGTWEWPGGHIDSGETAWQAACREWQEETGATLPDGQMVGSWTVGCYQGFLLLTDTELPVNAQAGRVLNPDDPDGDHIEVACWWDPADVPGNPALRAECQSTDWPLVFSAGRVAKDMTAGVTAQTGITGVLLDSGDHDDEDEDDAQEVAKELRRWRDNARNRVRKGLTPRPFVSEIIPAGTHDRIWARLADATTAEQVTEAFDDRNTT